MHTEKATFNSYIYVQRRAHNPIHGVTFDASFVFQSFELTNEHNTM